MGAKKLSFKIPLQSEVEVYIKQKKNWPDPFIKYYAERFWSFYASNGWKVSGKAAMKDWKAAFNSQWQTLKFKEDIEMFQSCGGKQEAKVIHLMQDKDAPAPGVHSDIERLDELLVQYQKSHVPISDEQLAIFAKPITVNNLWPSSITKEQMDKIKVEYKNDPIKCKAYFVQRTLVYYISFGLTFSGCIKARNKLL